MTIISAPQSFLEENLYVDLKPIFGQSLFLKCEASNFAGAIKTSPFSRTASCQLLMA